MKIMSFETTTKNNVFPSDFKCLEGKLQFIFRPTGKKKPTQANQKKQKNLALDLYSVRT